VELHVYAVSNSVQSEVMRIGKLSRMERGAYRLVEIDQLSGKLRGEIRPGQFKKLLVKEALENCFSKYQSFRWTYRCTGCGRQIRATYLLARLKYPTYIPIEKRDVYTYPQFLMTANPLPAMSNLPEAIRQYFNGVCWLGLPCDENLDPYDTEGW